jgi:hypothetical protein
MSITHSPIRDGRNLRPPTEFGTRQPRYIDWSTR